MEDQRVADVDAEADSDAGDQPTIGQRSVRWLWLLPFLGAAASLVSARAQHWVPVADGAVASVRTADLLRGHWSDLGLPASISEFTAGPQRYHPGPLMFWALAPFVALFGVQFGTAVGAVAVNTAAAVGAIRSTARAGRSRLTVLMAITTALTAITIWGPGHLYDPFNTMLPATTLLCGFVLAWRLACGDATLLPWAVVVASFCVQTHVVYAVPLLVTLVPGAVIALGPERLRPPGAHRATNGRIAVTASLAIVAWIGPLVEAAHHRGGNLRTLAGGTSGAATLGLKGARATLTHVFNLPPVQFQAISDSTFIRTLNLSALVVAAFAVWLGVRAVRSGDPLLRRLVAMAALAVLAAAATTAQLPDEPVKNGQMTFFKVVVPFVWFALLGSWVETWEIAATRVRLARGVGLGLALLVALEACIPFQIRNAYDPNSWLFDGTREVTSELSGSLRPGVDHRIDARGGAGYLLLMYGVLAGLDERGWEVAVAPDRESNYGPWRVSGERPGQVTLVIQDPLVAPPAGGHLVARYRPDVDQTAKRRLEAELLRRARAHGRIRLTSNGRHLLGDTLLGRPGIGPAEVRAFQRDPAKLLTQPASTLAALYRNDWVVDPPVPDDLRDEVTRLLGPMPVDVWAVTDR